VLLAIHSMSVTYYSIISIYVKTTIYYWIVILPFFDSHIHLETYSLFAFSDLLELPSQQFELVLFHCKLHDG